MTSKVALHHPWLQDYCDDLDTMSTDAAEEIIGDMAAFRKQITF